MWVLDVLDRAILTRCLTALFGIFCLLAANHVSAANINAATNVASAADMSNGVKPSAVKNGRQDLAEIKANIASFLTAQTVGYPGQVTISAGNIDPNIRLNPCDAMEIFFPQGNRAWGRTSVGVRCNAPTNWTIYVQASVNITAQYLVAATPLSQGHVMTDTDYIVQSGDLTQLPAGIMTDPEQVIGRSVKNAMMAGTALRQEMLKQPPVVQQGQSVTVKTSGQGFTISAEGQALSSAGDGQVVQVKVASGQIINGIARSGGLIEVRF